MTDSTRTYRVRSVETWDQARKAYLAGDTARVVCRRFGLGLSAFRLRAREEGWRREDQDDPDPYDPEAELEAVEDIDLAAMAQAARRRLQLALVDGEARDAVRWLDLFQTLSVLAAQAAPETRPEPPERDELHQLHPVFSDAGSESDQRRPDRLDAAPPPAVAAVLNRAERRRLRHAERLRRSSA